MHNLAVSCLSHLANKLTASEPSPESACQHLSCQHGISSISQWTCLFEQEAFRLIPLPLWTTPGPSPEVTEPACKSSHDSAYLNNRHADQSNCVYQTAHHHAVEHLMGILEGINYADKILPSLFPSITAIHRAQEHAIFRFKSQTPSFCSTSCGPPVLTQWLCLSFSVKSQGIKLLDVAHGFAKQQAIVLPP